MWSLNLNNNTRVHRAQFLSTDLNRNLDGRSSHLYFLWRKTLCLSAGCPRQIGRTPLIDPLDGNRPAGTHCFNLLFSLTIQYFYGNCSDFGTEASFSNSFYRIILFFISFLELRYLLWSGLSGLDSYWNAPWEMHWLAGLAGRARVRGDRTGVATASITPDWPRSLCLFTLGLILDRKHSLFTINNTWYSQHHPHQQHQQHHQDHIDYRQDRGQLSPSRVRVRGQTSLTQIIVNSQTIRHMWDVIMSYCHMRGLVLKKIVILMVVDSTWPLGQYKYIYCYTLYIVMWPLNSRCKWLLT